LRAEPSPVVPLREIEIRTSHASGPGGQNVNKLETRVEARWDIARSEAIGQRERARLLEALRTRLRAGTVLRVVSQRHRTQGRNREAAVERLQALVAEALRPRRARKATGPTASAKEARIAAKKHRAGLKRLRTPPREDADR